MGLRQMKENSSQTAFESNAAAGAAVYPVAQVAQELGGFEWVVNKRGSAGFYYYYLILYIYTSLNFKNILVKKKKVVKSRRLPSGGDARVGSEGYSSSLRIVLGSTRYCIYATAAAPST
ncbi:hypothetical protein LX32DRAFT_658186 [Colletotrichum zoysiae]|uniref:Uncharacterized protein n=1 Tax=Colletotrichum zoysiae TaxID=1216348 RepID=A0AAD9H5D4_9PEZI|nr:hypothetical protein LX32DRAFT_658186 [Colletotrichum zoysiae]